MAIERTLSIIKPDAVRRNLIGEIYSRFENNGLRIIAARMLILDPDHAKQFYAEHEGRPFFKDLIEFMSSGPVMVQVLEGENAIKKNRELMGATMPRNAEPGTIRRDLAYDDGTPESPHNAVHGSDGPEKAKQEIKFFFSLAEICQRPD